MPSTVKLAGGRTVEFESESDVLLFMGATLTYQQFALVYQQARGKTPPLKLYRENHSPEARVQVLNLAARTLTSDGQYLIDVLPGDFRAEWERISR